MKTNHEKIKEALDYTYDDKLLCKFFKAFLNTIVPEKEKEAVVYCRTVKTCIDCPYKINDGHCECSVVLLVFEDALTAFKKINYGMR